MATSVYWHFYVFSADPVPSWHQRIERPPPQVAKEFADRESDGPAQFYFEPDSEREEAFLKRVAKIGANVQKHAIGKWNERHIHQHKFYAGVFNNTCSQGFTRDILFERQLPCGIDPERGCGGACFQKRQVRKLRLERETKELKDFCEAHAHTMMVRVFVVSRRFFEVMTENKVSGVEFVPVLPGNRDWSSEALEFESRNQDLCDQACRFQMHITGRVRSPFQLAAYPHYMNNPTCNTCGVDNGQLEAKYEIDEEFLSELDWQMCYDFRLPGGEVIRSSSPEIVMSSKVVELIHTEKLKGLQLMGGKPKIRYMPYLLRKQGA